MADDFKPVPTLSTDGWVTNTEQKCDYLLSHFFAAEKSQTDFFPGKVHSLQWILQDNQNNMSGTQEAVQRSLSAYFGAYFPQVEVEVEVRDESPNSTRTLIQMYVNVTDVTGKQFSLGKLAHVLDTKIERILNINNTGIA